MHEYIIPFRGGWSRQNMFSKWNKHATYNTVHTLSSDRILYGNVCMVVCLVRFSYLIPGIHQSPRCQEEGDHLCATMASCIMEGSLAILTQPQRRDTQTLRRAEKGHTRSGRHTNIQIYDICIIQSHRVGWRTLRQTHRRKWEEVHREWNGMNYIKYVQRSGTVCRKEGMVVAITYIVFRIDIFSCFDETIHLRHVTISRSIV